MKWRSQRYPYPAPAPTGGEFLDQRAFRPVLEQKKTALNTEPRDGTLR